MGKSCMGLIEIASGKSIWRGMDYYNNKKVVSWDSPKAAKDFLKEVEKWEAEEEEPELQQLI